ncbi:hypothetical protein VT73_10360 [Rathayibacter toxicus]|uniref:Uncharacterized protein n=1 Tax=Rathayibacter toxicus TaxID=145458 RepID=A0A0C5BT09_9MICO|nr:hypothetical protein TI83_07415 [Rathayibacter toxicus]KKM44295.1 hypothetical protein VT73_10360 [Rathayibacter toxicus]
MRARLHLDARRTSHGRQSRRTHIRGRHRPARGHARRVHPRRAPHRAACPAPPSVSKDGRRSRGEHRQPHA